MHCCRYPRPQIKRLSKNWGPEQDHVKSCSERKRLQNCSQELEDFARNILNLKERASKLKVSH